MDQIADSQPESSDLADSENHVEDQTEPGTPDLDQSPDPAPVAEQDHTNDPALRWWHKRPGEREWKSGVRETVVALTVGVLAAGAVTGLGISFASRLDDNRAAATERSDQWRADQAERLENLRFVRERSDGIPSTPRPYNEIDLVDQKMAGLYLVGGQLREADLSYAHLPHADLSAADLSYAKLQGAVAYDTDFIGTDLTRARLPDAGLSSTDFTKAKLPVANLAGALLGDAVLTDAILVEANLDGANLAGATFTRTKLDGANLADANLAYAIDLTSEQLSKICKYGDRPPKNVPPQVTLPTNDLLDECDW